MCVPRTAEAPSDELSLPFDEGWIFIVNTALVMYIRLLWEKPTEGCNDGKDC